MAEFMTDEPYSDSEHQYDGPEEEVALEEYINSPVGYAERHYYREHG